MTKQRRIKVLYKKLAKVWGLAFKDGHIEIDTRAKGKKKLEILIHEMSHRLWYDLSEEEIETKSIIMTNTLWHEGYRCVDNANSQHLQDGKK